MTAVASGGPIYKTEWMPHHTATGHQRCKRKLQIAKAMPPGSSRTAGAGALRPAAVLLRRDAYTAAEAAEGQHHWQPPQRQKERGRQTGQVQRVDGGVYLQSLRDGPRALVADRIL